MNKPRLIDELTEYAARHITDAEALEMMAMNARSWNWPA